MDSGIRRNDELERTGLTPSGDVHVPYPHLATEFDTR